MRLFLYYVCHMWEFYNSKIDMYKSLHFRADGDIHDLKLL